jgi:curved DNA-binding protein
VRGFVPCWNHMQPEIDHYEVLQISRNADIETIHRVYRIMAARFHPDNPRTGNTETFLLLKGAYEVLVDPEQRAKYDSTQQIEDEGPLPIFELQDFVYGLKGEINRRLGVLALLYNRRRANQDHPGLSLLDLEKRMAFPREHLTFALWYLRSKGYLSQEDNSDCGITAEGIDFIESHSSSDDLIKRLIHAGPGMATAFAGESGVRESPPSEREGGVDTPPARLALTN